MRGLRLTNYEIGFRDPIESEKLNNTFSSIAEDLSEAFHRSQYIGNTLSEYISDRMYQQQQIDANNSALNALLTTAIATYAAAGGNHLYWSAYTNSGVSNSDSMHDVTCGNVTLSWSRSWTKLPLVLNDYNIYVPDTSIKAYYDDGTEVEKLQPDDIYDCIDNNPQTAWVKNYLVGVAPASVTVRLDIPASHNPAISSIYVAPFPNGGPTITSIEYITYAGTWVSISGFTSTNSRRRYHFSPVDYAGQIRFVMAPALLNDTNGNPSAIFGMQDIDISLIEYSNSSSFVVRLDSAPGNTISNITYVDSTYTISPSVTETAINEYDRPVVIEIFEDSNLTTRVYSNLINGHPFSGSLSLATPSSSVWVKYTLRKINSTTPVVRDITVRYT